MDCYEAVSGTRMHATYYRPGGVYRDLPDSMPKYQAIEVAPGRRKPTRMNAARSGSMLDFIEAFTEQLPGRRRRLRDAAHRQPHLEAAHRQHRRGHARARHAARLHGSDAARLRASPGTCARSSPTRSMRAWTSTCRWASTATATTATWSASRSCASRTASSGSASSGCARNPGPVMIDERKVRPPRREQMKERHGVAHPPFQILHRGLRRTRRRDLRGGRGAQGRVRRLSGLRRCQQALSPQVPRTGLRAPGGAGRDVHRSHAGRRGGGDRTQDIVFGEVDR